METKREMEENMVLLHTQIEIEMVRYTETHLKILELQREERRIIKQIILLQNKELKIADEYNKIKGGV